jgi:hypothetical protein
MAKRKLTDAEKKAILDSERPKYPGETVVVKDETDEDGNAIIGRIKIGPARSMPKGWKPTDPWPSDA